MEYVTLNNGIQMPKLGFGVYQIRDAAQCEQAVVDAVSVGYRLIDTAASYGNEEAVGRAVKRCGIPREELFLTTKLWISDTSYEGAKAAFHKSLERMGLDYLDLYLIHQPLNDYYGAWRAMEDLYREGIVKAIGVSNFSPERIVDLCMNHEIKPSVNQIEIHPFYQQEEALRVMRSYDIVPEAWGPLSEGQKEIFHHRTLQKISQRHGKTTAQVILRWHFQRGIVTIPKTVHKERMKENMDIWDFELTQKDMKEIEAMDIGHSEIIDHRCFCTARQLNSIKIHD